MKQNNYELSVQINNGVIESNLAELKKGVELMMQEYQNVVYTGEDAFAEMKEDRKKLNGLIKRIEDEKKKIKDVYFMPWNAFDAEMKSVVDIVKSTVKTIDDGVKEMEKQMREEKRKAILAFYNKKATETGFANDSFSKILLERIYDERWENKSTTAKTYQTAISNAVTGYLNNIAMLKAMNEPEFYDRAVEKYQSSMDIKDAVEYVAEKQKQRAEAEAARIRREAEIEAARLKAEAEAKAKAEAEMLRERERQMAELEVEKARIREEEAAKAKAEAEKKIAEALESAKNQDVTAPTDTGFFTAPDQSFFGNPANDQGFPLGDQDFFGKQSADAFAKPVQDFFVSDDWEPAGMNNPFASEPKQSYVAPKKDTGYVSPEYEQCSLFDEKRCIITIHESDMQRVCNLLATSGIWFEK